MMPDSSRVALLRSRRVDENRPLPVDEAPIGLLRDVDAQISFGERAALEGVLAQARPRLAIEIGTAEGGTVERLAHYSEEVVSLDLDCALARARQLPNVTFHEGDSHVLLPELLRGIADEGRNVDFVFVDGDHSRRESGRTPWTCWSRRRWRARSSSSTTPRTRSCAPESTACHS